MIVTHVAGSSPELRSKTILFVEDEILIRFYMAPELRAAGFTVIEAANADEALKTLNANQQINLLITDVRMPGSMDGVQLATFVRSTRPTVKIVIASAHAKDRPASETVDAFLDKPYFPEKMVKLVKELMGLHGQQD
jgi:CheY-like chemotaxis protein